MDCGTDYILICEKADEIQQLWRENIKTGDWYYDKGTLPYEITIFGGYYVLRKDGWRERVGDASCYKPYGEEIWLPRQDQLHLLSKLSWQEFDWECGNKYPLALTKEQAGIQVVMSQFNKEWKDNEWLDKTT